MKTLTWQKPGQQNVAQELIKIIINYVAELRGKRLLRIQIRLLLDNQVEIVVSDNGGGYRKVSVNHGTGTGMKVITQTIQLLNTYNSRPIQMKINNVLVGEEKEMGCEVRFVIPLNYSYQLKKN